METSNYKQKSILWILVKLKLREMFSGQGARNKKRTAGEKAGRAIGGGALILLYIVSYVLVAASLGALFFLIGTVMARGELSWMYFAYMAILMFLLCFVGSVFMTESQMFDANDNERLIAMPISSFTILMSRMVSLLFYNFLFGCIVAVPAGIVWVFLHGFDFIWLIFFLVAMVVIPLFALAFSMLAGWIISILSKKLKSTKFIKLAIAVVAALLYFYFVLGDGGWVNSLVENGARFADPIKTYLPPVYSIGQALANKNLLHFLLMILWCVVPFVIVSFLVSRNFLKLITSGSTTTRFNYKARGAKVSSPRMSLAKIELSRFTSSITYIMNGGMGLLLMVIMAFFALTNQSELNEMGAALTMSGLNAGGLMGGVLVLVILGIMGLVSISSATISLDAKTLWLPKSIPAKGSDILLAKAFPQIVVSLPFILVTSILLQLKLDLPLIDRFLVVLIPLTANVFNSIMGVRINARFPKFNWTNEAQAVKQGLSPLLVMILGILPVLVFVLGFVFLVVQSRISVRGLLILMEVVYLGLTLWMYLWAVKRGDRVIASLEP